MPSPMSRSQGTPPQFARWRPCGTRPAGRQISERDGVFYCEITGDRVKIAGHTVEVMTGMLDIQVQPLI